MISLGQLGVKLIHASKTSLFSPLSRMRTFVFKVLSIYLIDQYQNATPRLIPLYKMNKNQLQERVTILTHDSIGGLQMFYKWALWMEMLHLTAEYWKIATIVIMYPCLYLSDQATMENVLKASCPIWIM